jgi:ABC-type transporter Mla MlaB component
LVEELFPSELGSDNMHGHELKLRFSFEGKFSVDDARRTAGLLEGAAQGAEVRLDFTRCAQVDASGLACLAETIKQCGGSTEMLGLSRHDLKILKYLMGPEGETLTAPVDDA